MNILTLAREEDETSAQAGLAEKDPATGSAGEGNAHISGSGSAKTAAQMQGARRLADMVKGSVEGPIPNQTLSQFLNRAHVHAIVKRCVMDKETKDEVLDIVLNACEQTGWDIPELCKLIKRRLDVKLGATWHVVAGECYSFDIDHDSEYLIFLIYGSLGIVAWKCGDLLINEMKYRSEKAATKV